MLAFEPVFGPQFLVVHGMIGHNIIYGYADADFASDLDSRKSTSGWIFMYNGGAISWRSNQQNIKD